LAGLHVDCSKESNNSHVCVEICEPVDGCDDRTTSESHKEESLLEHILKVSGLCQKLFVLKLDRIKLSEFDVPQDFFQLFSSRGFLTPQVLTGSKAIAFPDVSSSRAPPVSF
jgi:hypothetical protein